MATDLTDDPAATVPVAPVTAEDDAAAVALERGQVAALEVKVRQLEELKMRANNPQFLEELARCQGFVKSGERVLIDSSMVGKSEAAPCEPRPLLPE